MLFALSEGCECETVASLRQLIYHCQTGLEAEAITRLQSQVKELSGKLADARHQEQQWACIAKRQRAYLQHSERLSQEGMQILRRHPAGEVFLAPPPVFLDDEDIRDEPVWDVGTGRTSSGGDVHCNPYVIDSWPFEPNVLAARASVQPNLNQWDEGDEDYDDVDEDLDEDDPQWQWDERMAPDEETSSLEPEHAMKAPVGRGATLPPLTVPVGGASARSL
ncbi:FRQ1 [Symbiodinium natans]|uniref:FRQ1 protein n=1 Tax=Symbiodinium natans TaxID=878477 RepID=A0A812NTJ5_9DINO|nr:FRQ1 [Symbiodinium natans]